ncbi:MAG: hypothetical protein WDM96_13900 [Lacunisphaera sp.]
MDALALGRTQVPAPKLCRRAGQTVVHCDWANAYYHRQSRAGKAHHAILRALAFKWIRILWRCWQDRKPYDETRYLASLRRHSSPLTTGTPKIRINILAQTASAFG